MLPYQREIQARIKSLKLKSRARRIQRAAERHKVQAIRSLHATHKSAKKLLKKHRVVLEKIRHHSVTSVTMAGLSASMLALPVAEGTAAKPAHAQVDSRELQDGMVQVDQVATESFGPDVSLATKVNNVPRDIKKIVPTYSANMTVEQEAAFSAYIQETYGVSTLAELEGVRLNATQGIMAGEQHLPLYPGDTLASHSSDPTRNLTGMVPGLPSWGYFADSRQSVTEEDIENERYYIAAQTFLSPGWKQNYAQLYDWFKYRKMFVVNPETGQAVVVDIADAGPSPFTHRTYGGSNEVLISLGLGEKRTGHVYVFFVNDTDGQVKLGPRSIQ